MFASSSRACTATGAAAISTSCEPHDVGAIIERITLKLSAAASTSENVIVTLDSGSGAAYDVILVQFDPATLGGATFVWVPDYPLSLAFDDAIVITYTNTDTRTYGLSVWYTLR